MEICGFVSASQGGLLAGGKGYEDNGPGTDTGDGGWNGFSNCHGNLDWQQRIPHLVIFYAALAGPVVGLSAVLRIILNSMIGWMRN